MEDPEIPFFPASPFFSLNVGLHCKRHGAAAVFKMIRIISIYIIFYFQGKIVNSLFYLFFLFAMLCGTAAMWRTLAAAHIILK